MRHETGGRNSIKCIAHFRSEAVYPNRSGLATDNPKNDSYNFPYNWPLHEQRLLGRLTQVAQMSKKSVSSG